MSKSESPTDTWRVTMGDDGEPIRVVDDGELVRASYERDEDTGEVSVTYSHDRHTVTVSPGETIVRYGGEEIVTIDGICVTHDPWVAVEVYVDLSAEDGGRVPMNPDHFGERFLAEWHEDGFEFYIEELEAASGDELTKLRWEKERDVLNKLSSGDEIIWGDRKEAFTVTDEALVWSQNVYIENQNRANGQEYCLEWRDGIPRIRKEGPNSETVEVAKDVRFKEDS